MERQAEKFQELLKKAKKNKKGLLMLKNVAVRCQAFELAADLRGLEKKLFPESKEVKDSKNYQSALNMVGFNISQEGAWVIAEAMKSYFKMKGSFSIKESTGITVKAKELFKDLP